MIIVNLNQYHYGFFMVSRSWMYSISIYQLEKFVMLSQIHPYFVSQKQKRVLRELQKVEHAHSGLLQKFVDKSHSLRLQMDLVAKIDHPLLSSLKTNLEDKIRGLQDYLEQQDLQRNEQLLEKQSQIESHNQSLKVVHEYQARLTELAACLYNKELQITVEHTGKKQLEKPRCCNLLKHQAIETNDDRISHMLKYRKAKLQSLQTQIPQVTGKNNEQQGKMIIDSKENEGQSTRDNRDSQDDKQNQLTARFNRSRNQHSHSSNLTNQQKTLKMISMAKSQLREEVNRILCDPLTIKISKMLLQEHKKEQQLLNEYQLSCQKLHELGRTNALLAKLYKNLLANKTCRR